MREIVNINIGQAGVQISNAIWELFCLEHGIDVNGELLVDNLHSCHSIFQERSNNRHNPRVLTIDLEPTVIDEIRTGVYRDLFSSYQLISGLEDSACNFARGHFTIGRIYLKEFITSLRKIVEQCDSLQCLMIVQSFGGGCGSGFTCLALEQMEIEHPKSSKMQFSVLPSQHLSSAVVEPYNFILSAKSSILEVDMSFQHDNESLQNLIQKKLNKKNPTFSIINRLLAQVFSSITVSIRYENALNNDMLQMATNIIPFPRLHYLLNFYAPICNTAQGKHYLSTTLGITKDVFNLNNKLLDCDFAGEKFISCCLQYRGDISPIKVNQALLAIKKIESIKFVDWCPTGFKIGINRSPSVIPKSCEMFDTNNSVLLICNNSCYHQKIGQLITKFDMLYQKRSFVHWFVGEGMEEGEFVEARDEFTYVMEDYRCLIIDDLGEVNKDGSVADQNLFKTQENVVTINDEVFEIVEGPNDEMEYNELFPAEDVDLNAGEKNSDGNFKNEKVDIRESDIVIIKEQNDENYKDDNDDESFNELGTDIEIEPSLSVDENLVLEKLKISNIDPNAAQSPPMPSEIDKDDRLSRLNKFLNKDTDSTHSEISPL